MCACDLLPCNPLQSLRVTRLKGDDPLPIQSPVREFKAMCFLHVTHPNAGSSYEELREQFGYQDRKHHDSEWTEAEQIKLKEGLKDLAAGRKKFTSKLSE